MSTSDRDLDRAESNQRRTRRNTWRRIVGHASAAMLVGASLPLAAATPSMAAAPATRAVAPSTSAAAEEGAYHGLNPVRLLDTRLTSSPIGPDQTLDLGVTGMAGVPSTGVDAVVLNVVATDGTANTYLDVYPSGESPAVASSVNADRDATVSNLVIAKIGSGGMVTIYNHAGNTQVVVDIEGWFGAADASNASTLNGLDPVRLLDTRTTNEPISADSTMDLTVTDVGGVPATGVDAVVLDVVATEGTASTYLDVYPTGETPSETSTLNADVGATVANLVIAKVGAGGKVTIYNHAGSTNVVVDVQGWFAASPATAAAPTAAFHALSPSRLLDTRSSAEPIGPDSSIDLGVAGVAGVPATGATAVALDVVATEGTSATYLDVYPSGAPRNTTSNVNADAGRTVSNLVIATVGADGKVVIYNHSGSTQVVVDIQGWFGPGALTASSPPDNTTPPTAPTSTAPTTTQSTTPPTTTPPATTPPATTPPTTTQSTTPPTTTPPATTPPATTPPATTPPATTPPATTPPNN
ncbi:MAG: subtilase family protease, partial [Ilumatobacteraceae bacterium]|nr:subtilase family protease [Ilumatobacteraceae bacterium]